MNKGVEISAQGRLTKTFARLGIIAVFSAFAFLSTTFIRIPVPVSGGYFNIGDAFVMGGAVLFGPVVGGLVGLIGPTLSDAIGYPQFIPATAVIKLVEGLVVGLVGFGVNGVSPGRCIIGLAAGGVIIVGGYFVFEAFFYPQFAKVSPFFDVTNMGMAIGEIVPNVFQAVISALLAFGMWRMMRGAPAK